jgi:hypothetical protein
MIKTEKLKVKSKVTSVNGGMVNINGGGINFSDDAVYQMLNIFEKKRDPYWYKEHDKLLQTLYLVRDTLVTLFEADDIGAIRNKLVNVIEEAIGAQK